MASVGADTGFRLIVLDCSAVITLLIMTAEITRRSLGIPRADKPDLCNEFHSAGLSLRPLESSCWNIRQETAGTLIDAAKYLQTINRPRRVDPHKTTKLILNTRE